MKTEYLLIGEIVKPQGVRGEIKLRQESQDPERYAKLREVWLRRGNQYEPYKVQKGRCQGGFAYLKLEGIDDRDGAEALRNVEVYVDREHAIQLPEGEYFICDLIGLEASTEDGTKIGTLKDVISHAPAIDVYVFDTVRGEMMMPALKKAILKIDIEAGQMILDSQTLGEIASWEDEPAERDE